jgi:hypothetical protein
MFQGIIDFAAPISEDPVRETLDQVLRAFWTASKSSRDGEDAVKEHTQIRTIVGADRGVWTSRCVSALIKGCRESQVIQCQIENDQR